MAFGSIGRQASTPDPVQSVRAPEGAQTGKLSREQQKRLGRNRYGGGAVFGSSQSGGGVGGFGGGPGGPAVGGGQPGGFGGGSFGGFAEASGWGSGTGPGQSPAGSNMGEVKLTAEESPQMKELTQKWEEHQNWLREQATKVDTNLQEQIAMYRERMGEGPTTRAIERSASTIRDFAAGQAQGAQGAAAAMGRDQGFGATGIAESAQRAQAGAAADISLGREGQLDRLLATGTNIMSAPGQRELAWGAQQGQHFAQNPYGQAANLGLAEKQLGLQAWMAPRQLGIQEMQAQAAAQGSPIDWYRMLFS